MVRWIDGFYGGLVAGAVSAAFDALVGGVWLHDTAPSELFGQVAQALPPFHGAAPSWALAGLGVVMWLLLGVAFGIVYALLARRVGSMWRAPGSVVWGLCYGLLVWWVINDVAVPVTGVPDTQPLVTGLVGTVVFYGVVLSEATTLAVRRAEARQAP